MAKVAIIYYSLHGHIAMMADATKRGVEAAGGKADLYRIAETLPQDVLTKMHAAPHDPSIPTATVATMTQYDAFLFGIPTRFGTYSAQWKAFIDQLGHLWQKGALGGKFFGVFVGTATQGGGQEITILNALSTWVHQGMIYVPLGYSHCFPQLSVLDEVRGGSPWGAGTFSGDDGRRKPSGRELELAEVQGRAFYECVERVRF